MTNNIPVRLQNISEDFQACVGREKLELLIEYAQNLEPLPEWLQNDRQNFDEVPECMTPVFIHAEVKNNRIHYYFDVPAESPTVRGFAGLLGEGVNGSLLDEVLLIPNDYYLLMGLDQVLTHQRLNGLSAILAHMKRLAVENIEIE